MKKRSEKEPVRLRKPQGEMTSGLPLFLRRVGFLGTKKFLINDGKLLPVLLNVMMG